MQLELDVEGVGNGLVDGTLLRGRQLEGAANDDVILGPTECRHKSVLGRAFESLQAGDEELADTGLQAGARHFGERLARDVEHLGLGALAQGLDQSLRFAGNGGLPLGGQRIGILARGVHQGLAFGIGVGSRFLQQRGTLLLEVIVLLLEFFAFVLGLGLLAAGRGQLGGNAFLPRIDGIQDRLVEEALHQPHQDDEVQRLRRDGEPVDQHGYFPATLAACAIAAFQNGLAKIRIIDTTKQ